MTRLIEHEPSPAFLAANDHENWTGWLSLVSQAQTAIDHGYLEVAKQRIDELRHDAICDLKGMAERGIILDAIEQMRDELGGFDPAPSHDGCDRPEVARHLMGGAR